MTTNLSEGFLNPDNIRPFPSPGKTDEQQPYIDSAIANKYRSTGECNDPKLKGVLKRIHDGERLLSPKRAERLVKALLEGVDTVEKSVFLLKDKIDDLEFHLSLPENNSSEIATTLKKEIATGQKDLNLGINRVLNISRKHGQFSGRKFNHQYKNDYQQSQKLIDDITYLQRFLIEQAQVSVVAFEQSPHPQAYFRRVKDYLNYLPGFCRLLVNLTRQSIFNKVPGTQSDDLTL